MQNPALKHLDVFIGDWEMELSEMSFLSDPSAKLHGHVSFEWLEDEAFLVMRVPQEQPDAPGSVSVISRDDTTETAKMLYFDTRGVSRIYDFSLNDGVWKMWREAPGFSQRFEGQFGPDGDSIGAYWEKSFDGTTWQRDFNIKYTRSRVTRP